MIGWESDNETVGPRALAAKQSLLRALPFLILEEDSNTPELLYSIVLEHSDFGVHNVTTALKDNGKPNVTSLETGCFVPVILSDPEVSVCPVDLNANCDGEPFVTRIPEGTSDSEMAMYEGWARYYVQVCFVSAIYCRELD
ncbi:hypothetical protein BDW69DRAFT_160766 [Aspergillus filifer]